MIAIVAVPAIARVVLVGLGLPAEAATFAPARLRPWPSPTELAYVTRAVPIARFASRPRDRTCTEAGSASTLDLVLKASLDTSTPDGVFSTTGIISFTIE